MMTTTTRTKTKTTTTTTSRKVWTADDLERCRHLGDPVADAAVAAVFADEGEERGRRLLTTVIRHPWPPRHEWPVVIADYLDQTAHLPDWVDHDLIDEAEAVFEEHGWMTFGLLGCSSLPQGYAVHDIAMVLGTTQDLEEHVYRRIWETAQFTLDVMSRGGLEPGSAGLQSAQRVRLLHAVVRHLILEEPEKHPASTPGYAAVLAGTRWPDECGMPVSQAYMAGTILAFSYLVLRGLEDLGFSDITDRQKRAYLHRWNVVGHLLGLRDELMATDMEEAASLFHGIRDPHLHSTPQGKALTDALLQLMEGLIPAPLFPLKPLPRMLMVKLSRPQVTDLLDVRLSSVERWLTLPLCMTGMRAWDRVCSRLDRDLPLVGGATRWFFRHMFQEFIGHPRGGHRGCFTIPAHLRRSWGM
jgi:hypothetical protein